MSSCSRVVPLRKCPRIKMGGCWMVVARMVASGYSFSSLGSQTKEVKVLFKGREGGREGGRAERK